MTRKAFFILLIVIGALIVISVLTAEYYTSQNSFCGSCHIMKPYYDSWAKSKHGKEGVACVDCHYPPGEKHALKSKFRGLGQVFSYLAAKEATVRKRARVNDRSCTTSDCHPEQQLKDKKTKFEEKIPYVHKTHFDKTIEGQTLHCSTCHQHVRKEFHFEVPNQACYLCHFKSAKFNEGRAKCSLCHEIPTKPLQKQKKYEADSEEKPITHQSLEEAKVPCWSCHYELVQGEGEVNKEGCFGCHEYSDEMKRKSDDKKLMHEEHVAEQNAKCFDCHMQIQHRETEFFDPVRLNCSACHPDHHIYQRILLVGDKRKNIPATPSLMFNVKTNCLGCHREERIVNGEKVAHGSAKACAACHTENHEAMAKEWKDKAAAELENAGEIEKEAIEAIDNAKDKVSKDTLNEAIALLEEGQENMRTVEYGGGVHNKKYSVMLLDAAMDNFEDIIDLLDEE